MTSILTRGLRALAIGLVATGLASSASAASITEAATTSALDAPIGYQTVGSVGDPTVGPPGVVYYTGVTTGAYDGAGSIDLGNFVVSTLAKTTNSSYTDTPFQIIASVGGDAAEKISGVINGQFGPAVDNPSLTATITSISQFGNNPLPFTLGLPLNSPLPIALPGGDSFPTVTGLVGAVVPNAPPIPEPTSIAVFAVALGGLGLWRRRAAR